MRYQSETLSSLPFPHNILSKALVDDISSSEGYNAFEALESLGANKLSDDDPSGISDGRAVKRSSSINQLRGCRNVILKNEVVMDDHHWNLCDKVWTLVSKINGRGQARKV